MSGHKKATVTISEQDYHRLLEAENRLRFQQSKPSHKDDHALDASVQKIWDQIQDMESRQVEFLRLAASSGQSFEELETQSARLILEQGAVFQNDLEAYKDEFFEATRELVAQQHEYYSQAIVQEHQLRQQEMLKLNRKAEQDTTSKREKIAIAQQWIEACRKLHEFIGIHYHHEKFSPSTLESLRSEINQSISNIQSGLYEAAIIGAQLAYSKLSRLRIKLEWEEQEWVSLREAALYQFYELSNLAAESQFCSAIDLEGNELSDSIPVDIWTHGRLSLLRDQLEKWKTQLQTDTPPSGIDQLRSLINEQLPELQDQLFTILHQARMAVISSQLRVNIADIVIQALRSQGFSFVSSHYENQDMEKAFSVSLAGLDGSQVTVKIVPSLVKEGENELFINNHPSPQITDHELRLRASEIRASLGEFGLQVSTLQDVHPANPQSTQPARMTTGFQPKLKKV